MRHHVTALGRRVDLNLVTVFEAIYATRNLTAAGERLGLSQPAMSHALARLRWALQDPLFVRVPRGLEPTPLADELAPALSEGLAVIRGSFERAAFNPAASTRLFTLAMSDLGEVAHLPRVHRAIRAQAPGVRIRTIEVTPAEAKSDLAEGRIDLALGVDMKARRPYREATLATHGYSTLVRRGHPRIGARLTAASFRDADHLLVMPTGSVKHGDVVGAGLSAVGASVVLQVAHFHAVASIVTQTDLIATVPRGLAESLRGMVDLRVFACPVALPDIRVSMYWHERQHRDPGNRWLREIYVREIARRPA